MTKTTTLDIELAIMNYFNFRYEVMVPNVSNMMGLVPFEVDMLILRKSDLAYGFEIKTSKADLRADFKKPQHTEIQFYGGKTSHERWFGKFKYFYYAVPEDLKQLALELIPAFCGLAIFDKKDFPEHSKFYIERQPKSLFNYHWNAKERYELARLGTMRIKNLKQKIAEYKTTIAYLKKSKL